jgi:hypothetical protein
MFDQLYFWMHWYLRKNKANHNPSDSAFLLICSLQSLNIGTIFVVVNHFLKLTIHKKTSVYSGLAIGIILYAINHFLLYSRRDEIFRRFKNRNHEKQNKGKLLFWFYVLMTLSLFVWSVLELVTPQY